MSYILKALKKVEDEKADRKKGEAGIAGEILRGEGDRARRRNWLLPVTAAAFIILAGLGVYFWDADSPTTVEKASVVSFPAEVSAPQTGSIQVVTGDEDENEVPNEDGAEGLTRDLLDSTRETREIIAVNRRTADALKDTAESLRHTAVSLEGKVVLPPETLVAVCEKAATEESAGDSGHSEPFPGLAAPSRPAGSGSVAVSPAVTSSESKWGYLLPAYEAPEELEVSEIYYSSNVKDRMAVVNELPVMEGVMVEGARVDRIFRERIRFVVDGKYKEVLLRTP